MLRTVPRANATPRPAKLARQNELLRQRLDALGGQRRRSAYEGTDQQVDEAGRGTHRLLAEDTGPALEKFRTAYEAGKGLSYVVISDEKGEVVHWSGEMSSVFQLSKAGWNRNSIKPGDQVTVTLSPSRAGAPAGVMSLVILV